MEDNNKILEDFRKKIKFRRVKSIFDNTYRFKLAHLVGKLDTDEAILEAINISNDPFIEAILISKLQNQYLKVQFLKGKLKNNFYKGIVIETLEDDEIKSEFLKDIKDGIEQARGATTFKNDKYKKMFFDMVDNKGDNVSRNKAEIAISVNSDELRDMMLAEIYGDFFRKKVIKSFKEKKYVDNYFEEIKGDKEILKIFYPEIIKEEEKAERRETLKEEIAAKRREVKRLENNIAALKEKLANLNEQRERM